MKLYEIPAIYRRIDELLDESGGEITPQIEALEAEAESGLSDRVDAYASLIKEYEYREDMDRAEAERIAAEAKFFSDRAKVRANTAKRLKARLMDGLAAMGLDRAEGRRFRVNVQASGPAIHWAGDGEIPEGFRRIDVRADLVAAQVAYKRGSLPEGFVVTNSKHLRVR